KSGTDTDALALQADLAIAKSDGVDSVVPGNPDTYTIAVTNNGPSTVNSVTLSDTIPNALLNPVFGTPSSGSFNTTSEVRTVTLASGASATITLAGTIDPAATGSITNTVTVSPPSRVSDISAGKNTATDTDPLSPQADLAIAKSDGVTSVVPGPTATYTTPFPNTTLFRSNSVTLSDTIPNALLNPVFGTPSSGTFNTT